ncbi:MAG: hypothetical protein RLZZ383_2380 [Pseudomonadota bacterium]|jgi:hypothetical protein
MRSRVAVWVLSVVMPLLVFAGAWWALQRPAEATGPAASFEQDLAKYEPDVIVFGSSLANRGVNLPILARSLGLPENKVYLMQMPHSSIAHWYAMLKNRVYGAGHRPKLVLVVDALASMIHHDLLTELDANVDRLVGQMSPDEPVLAAKVFHVEDAASYRKMFLDQRAGELREQVVHGWRDLWLARATRRGTDEEIEALVARVNDEVFANDRMDYERHGSNDAASLLSASAVPTTASDFELQRDALLPDMADLAKAHGTNLVYVRIPLPPSNPTLDEVPSEIEAEATRWIEDLGGIYLDMRSLDLDDSYFEDMRHLSARGAELFTSALGRVLVALHALDPGAGGRSVRALETPDAVVEEGALPTLPDPARALRSGDGCTLRWPAGGWAGLDTKHLEAWGALALPLRVEVQGQALAYGPGAGCAGRVWVSEGQLWVALPQPGATPSFSWAPHVSDAADPEGHGARWLAPGTKVRLKFSAAWTLPEAAFKVFARGYKVGDGRGDPVVSVGASTFTLTDRQGRLGGGARLAAPTEPDWELQIEVPADGAWVYLHHLAIGAAPSTAFVHGRAETLHGSSFRVVGGRVEDTGQRATYAAAPPVVPLEPKLRRGGFKAGAFELPTIAHLADSAARDDDHPNKCSPVYVTENGAPLMGAHSPCADVVTLGEGRTCFAGDMLVFAASDGTDPLTNGRTYGLVLSPRRVCDVYAQKNAAFLRDSWWLYPGDVATFTVAREHLAAFRDGVNSVEVEVMSHVASLDVPLQVEVVADGVTVLQQTWQPEGVLKRRRVTWALDRALAPTVREVVLRFTNPSAKAFPLLTSVTLGEDYDVFGDGPAKASTVAADASTARVEAAASRTGVPLVDLASKRATLTGMGAVEAKVFPVWPISDAHLDKLGLPAGSPVTLSVDGVALRHERDRRAFKQGCDACFFHTGQSLVFFAPGAGKDAALTVGLDADAPTLAADGTAMWWVYPGTTLSFDVPPGLKGTVVVEGVAFHPQEESLGQGFLLESGSGRATLARGASEGLLLGEVALGDSLRVRGETPGGFFLVRKLRIQSERSVTWLIDQPLPDGGRVVGE